MFVLKQPYLINGITKGLNHKVAIMCKYKSCKSILSAQFFLVQILASFLNIPELSSCHSKTGFCTYKYSAINCIHHLKPSLAVVTGINHFWPSLSTIIFWRHLNLSEIAMFSCVDAAAGFSANGLWNPIYYEQKKADELSTNLVE